MISSARLLSLTAILILLSLPEPASGQERSAVGQNSPTGEYVSRDFGHDGRNRQYRLYVPDAYDPQGTDEWPLVISFHGQTWNNSVGPQGPPSQPWLDEFAGMADTAQFLVVWPQGLWTPQPQYPGNGWNVHGGFGNWDEVGFVSRLIDHIGADYRVDPHRIHATGFSHGGMMGYVLACRLAERIASVVSVAAAMPDIYFDRCQTARPVAIAELHGTADPIHAITGYQPGGYVTRPVVESIDFWAEHNECDATADSTALPDLDTSDNSTVTLFEYPGCKAGTEVQYYRIENGGHIWPGRRTSSSILGTDNMDIHASSLIWQFFVEHPHYAPFKMPAMENVSLVGYWGNERAMGIIVHGDMACVDESNIGTWPGSKKGSWLIDVSQPAFPAETRRATNYRNGVPAGDLLYLLTYPEQGEHDELHIFDIADPSNVVQISAFELWGRAADLIVDGTLAYVALQNFLTPNTAGLQIIDVSDPAAPFEVSYMPSTPTDYQQLVVEGDLAYLASPSGFGSLKGLHIIDVSDPAEPVELMFDTTRGAVYAANGNLVFSGPDRWSPPSLHILDISDPAAPAEAGFFLLPELDPEGEPWDGNPIRAVATEGRFAYVAIHKLGMLVLDIQDPANPVEVGYFRPEATIHDVDIEDGYIYLASDDGLYIVENNLVVTGTDEDYRSEVPSSMVLHQNYPNPFNPATTIAYELAEAGDVRVTIFDAMGRMVERRALEHVVPGVYTMTFDAGNLASGPYFYRLEAGGEVRTKGMVVLK
jgi:polyhydroxybutyrate depolymerase